MASGQDEVARAFAARHASNGARLLTPKDLSRAGWRHGLGDLDSSAAVVAGRPCAACHIMGVVIRLPGVLEQDLSYIVPPDRAYVAAEMNAFLRFWLRELCCPMLNRPTRNSLAGPQWRQEQWVYTAARLGIPVMASHRHIARASACTDAAQVPPEGTTVTIVGGQHFGAVDQALARQARCLADVAGVDLLAVRFSGAEPGSRFVSANPWPDITPDDVADAILEYLQEGSR
ncbi:MAG: hypothetical protein ACRERE_12450 [Candidatus Entotheonellia bacterium]